MATQFDIVQASNILKEFYLPPIQEALNNSTALLSKLDRDENAIDGSGKYFTWPVHYGRNNSAGVGRKDGETLQSPGAQSYATAKQRVKYLYGRIYFSGPVIAATKNDKGAFLRAVESELKGLKRDFEKSLNRQLHGNGTFNHGTYVSGTGTTIFIDDGAGHAFSYLPKGEAVSVDIVDAGSTVVADSVEGFFVPGNGLTTGGDNVRGYLNLAVNATRGAKVGDTLTVTLGAALGATPAVGDYLIPAGSFSRQLTGLEAIVNDVDTPFGALSGIAVTNEWWKAQIVGSDSAVRELSFADMQSVVSLIASETSYSEKDIDLIIGSYGMRDRYAQKAKDERIVTNKMELDGGFKAISFNGMPIVPDNDAKPGRFYFLVTETLALFRTQDFQFMEKDGSMFHRDEDRDMYKATLVHYGDLGVRNRNGNGLLRGIVE